MLKIHFFGQKSSLFQSLNPFVCGNILLWHIAIEIFTFYGKNKSCGKN